MQDSLIGFLAHCAAQKMSQYKDWILYGTSAGTTYLQISTDLCPELRNVDNLLKIEFPSLFYLVAFADNPRA